MVNFRNRHVAAPVALLLSMALAVVAALVWGSGATSAAPARTTTAAAAAAQGPVAQSPQGKLSSRIVGSTANGRDVTGKFVPLKFNKRNGRVIVRGLLQGVVHNNNGTKRTFSAMRTLRVKTIEGQPVRAGSASRTAARGVDCDVLRLVLGPLDLNILGLQIDLSRVVLNIVAQSGAGNLLGNLLCAVAGLLDGGLNGLLGRLANLLNRILGRLGLGV